MIQTKNEKRSIYAQAVYALLYIYMYIYVYINAKSAIFFSLFFL